MAAKPTKIILICAAAAAAIVIGGEIFKTVRFRKYCESTDGMKTQIDTVRSFATQAIRGDILDCRGNILATSDTVYNVHLDAIFSKDSLWQEALPALSNGLTEIIKDKTSEEYYRYLSDGRAEGKRYLNICNNVGQSTIDSLKSLPLFNLPIEKGGVIIEARQRRIYPYGPLARRTIGFVRDNNELYNNHIGIEGSFNKVLSGKDGYGIIKDKYVRLPFGKVKHIHKAMKVVEPENGKNVSMALDIELQAVADSLLRAGIEGYDDIKGACLVLVGTNNGAIRTMVNLTKDEKGEFWESYNVSIGYGYEPGRIIAPATALAAAKCDSTLSLDGLDLTSKEVLASLAEKCNPSAYCDSLSAMLKGEYAFDHLEIDGLANLKMITPADHYWNDRTLYSISTGYSVMAPAYQWLRLYTAIARGGEGIAQRLVDPISIDDDKRMLYTHCTKEQADALTESLKAASVDKMSDAAFEMAGISGSSFIAIPGAGYTDELGRHALQSSYAGFFPADNPAFSIICMVYTMPMSEVYSISGISSQIVKEFVNSSVVAERVKEMLD